MIYLWKTRDDNLMRFCWISFRFSSHIKDLQKVLFTPSFFQLFLSICFAFVFWILGDTVQVEKRRICGICFLCSFPFFLSPVCCWILPTPIKFFSSVFSSSLPHEVLFMYHEGSYLLFNSQERRRRIFFSINEGEEIDGYTRH